MNTPWFHEDAVELCRKVEAICPQFGCHVALTGGLLYKDGARKDCDLLFYRIRQVEEIDVDGLFGALASIGLTRESGFGWVYKATFEGKPVDCFFPEADGGEYERADPNDLTAAAEYRAEQRADDLMMERFEREGGR